MWACSWDDHAHVQDVLHGPVVSIAGREMQQAFPSAIISSLSESASKPGHAGPCEDVSGNIERYNTYFRIIYWLDLLTVAYLSGGAWAFSSCFPQALRSEAWQKLGCPHAPHPNHRTTRSCTRQAHPLFSAHSGHPFLPGKPSWHFPLLSLHHSKSLVIAAFPMLEFLTGFVTLFLTI